MASNNNQQPSNHDGEGDSTDARKLFGRISPPNVDFALLSVSPESEVYNMKHPNRGQCLIFNNKTFDPHTNLNVRKGTDSDETSLYQRFRELDFDVIVHRDYSVKQILSTLEKVAKQDHSKNDCVVCCILTHGDQGILFGRDGKFPTDQMFAPFRGDVCPSLAGKPKLFFIQACQGDKLDRGVKLMSMEHTDAPAVCKIPTHADFLIVYSTVPGFYSWRNTTEGSWFAQALCKVLKLHAMNMDLLQMMTIVNRRVAYDFESCVPNDSSMHMMKQVPCVTSTLTRKIYFPRDM